MQTTKKTSSFGRTFSTKGLEQKQNQNMYWRRHNLKKRLTFEQLSSENKNCQINNKVNKNNNVSLHHYSFAFLFLLLSVLECPIGIHFVYSIFCLIRWRRCSSRSSERKNPINVPQMSTFTNSQHSNFLPVLRRTPRSVIVLRICMVSRPFLIFGGSLQIIIAMEKRTIICLWIFVGHSRVLWIFPCPFTMAVLMSGTMLWSRNSHWNHVHSLIYINRGEKLLHGTWTYFQVTSWYYNILVFKIMADKVYLSKFEFQPLADVFAA